MRWLPIVLLALGCGSRSEMILEPPADAAVDVAPVRNACGGTAVLPSSPDTACGTCGLYACHGPDAVRCDETLGRNACGECGPLPEEVCNGHDDDCDGATDEGCVRRLATLPTNDTRVRLSGDRAVFDATGFNHDYDIALADLRTGEVQVLTPHATPLEARGDPSEELSGAIDGDLVAWITRGSQPFDPVGRITAHDLRTGVARVVSGDLAASAPAVDGGRVAFQSMGPPDRDVWIWSRDSGELRHLATPGTHEQAPDLSGDWVVFERGPTPETYFHTHIYATNLRTGEELQLSTGLEGWHVGPAIDGRYVVWHQERGDHAPSDQTQVYLYDLETRTRRALTTEWTASAPRISGTLACWNTRADNGSMSVTAMDLATGRTRVLAREASGCDVSGRRVVFTESRGGTDPYVYELLDDEP